MPHRVHFLTTTMTHAIEFSILSILAVSQGIQYAVAVISQQDWERITGPHAFLFGLIVAVGVLWNSGRVREKNENARREKEEAARLERHKEMLSTNKENAEALKSLTVESILAQGKATRAVEKMDANIQRLTMELAERPCQASEFKKPNGLPPMP